MERNKPIASQYSLDKLEKLVLKDVARIEEQLAAIELVEDSTVRTSTIAKYKTMIEDRSDLLTQIKDQAREFKKLDPGYSQVG